MRKKIVGLIIAGILVLVFGLASTPARAKLSLGVVGGYYSPNFGKINDEIGDCGWWNNYYGSHFEFEFKAGMIYGLALGLDLGPRFGLRLEHNRFESKTSDNYRYYWGAWETNWDEDFKLTVTPVILSLLYGFSPFHIGAGVGSFSTKVKNTWEWGDSLGGFLVNSGSGAFSDSDSPIGVVLLAGLGFERDPVFLNLEARYVVGTKAKLELGEWHTEVDLSGLQVSLIARFKLK